MTTQESKSGKNIAGIAKWLVIGVLALTFMFLFKEPLTQLINRATDVEITKEGVKIKTVRTPLGETDVSVTNVAETTEAPMSEGLQANTFTSRRHKFSLSWPDNLNWTASEEYGRTLHSQLGLSPAIDIPIVIMKNEMVGNFIPNVNVVVEPVAPSMTVDQYLNLNIPRMKQMGWTILSSSTDPDTQGGLLVFLNNSYGDTLYQFQRFAIANGKAYVITASQLPPDNLLSQNLRADLNGILNSFQLIK